MRGVSSRIPSSAVEERMLVRCLRRQTFTSLVDLQNAVGFPMGSVRHQHFAWLPGVGLRPEEQQAHRMIHLRDAHRCSEIPLRMAADGKLRAHERPERLEPRAHRRLRSADDDRAVERQVAEVGALGAVDVIHDRCVGEVTVEGEIIGDGLGDHPINQFVGQVGVILEWTCVISRLRKRRKSRG